MSETILSGSVVTNRYEFNLGDKMGSDAFKITNTKNENLQTDMELFCWRTATGHRRRRGSCGRPPKLGGAARTTMGHHHLPGAWGRPNCNGPPPPPPWGIGPSAGPERGPPVPQWATAAAAVRLGGHPQRVPVKLLRKWPET